MSSASASAATIAAATAAPAAASGLSPPTFALQPIDLFSVCFDGGRSPDRIAALAG